MDFTSQTPENPYKDYQRYPNCREKSSNLHIHRGNSSTKYKFTENKAS